MLARQYFGGLARQHFGGPGPAASRVGFADARNGKLKTNAQAPQKSAAMVKHRNGRLRKLFRLEHTPIFYFL
jgi:hypothetical protein